MKKIIVVGSGFSGSIIARKIAEDLNRKVILIEKRNHTGGNAHDFYDEKGILIQKYGPHFLNTNNYGVIKYLSKFSPLFPHNTKLLSYLDGKYVRLPFNFQSVQELVGAENSELLLGKLRKDFQGRDRVPILELVDSRDEDISNYGNLLFEKAYKTYTSKMWGIGIDKVDKYVLERVPMAMNYDERYLNKDFQYLPVNGFNEIFENMLKHPNIKLMLNEDALNHIKIDEDERKVYFDNEEAKCIIFTGAIDELFEYKFGKLPYRSLDIKYEYYDQNKILPCEIISYPQAEGYTRSTEYRQIMFKQDAIEGTVVATEYPIDFDENRNVGNIRYYPVNTEESDKLYKKYLNESQKYGNIFLCGRLAEFKYYNMDVCIEHAIKYFDNIKYFLEKN